MLQTKLEQNMKIDNDKKKTKIIYCREIIDFLRGHKIEINNCFCLQFLLYLHRKYVNKNQNNILFNTMTILPIGIKKYGSDIIK